MPSKNSSRESDQPSEKAILNLTIDGSFPEAEVREVRAPDADAFQAPCTWNGLMAGVSGGVLGYAFGFAGYWFRYRLQGSWKASLADGWTSARTFGVMGGLYAAVSCFMVRLRQKQDAWNGAASGCATGLALGWSGGPMSALQSCAMLGAFSYFLDGMAPAGGDGEAQAAMLNCGDLKHRTGSGRGSRVGLQGANETGGGCGAFLTKCINGGRSFGDASPLELFLNPAMPLAAALRRLQPCAGDVEGGHVGCAFFSARREERKE